MIEPRESAPLPSLRRVGPGHYQTRDERLTVVKNPSEWGITSWLVYDRDEVVFGARDMPLVVESLREAREQIAGGAMDA